MVERQRIGAVVQARMSSRRLPGKVLRPLCGKPLLVRLFERLAQVKGVDLLVLSTSVAPDDDAIERFAHETGILCYRGPLDDVAMRLLETTRAHALDAVVRISGDSPLIDPAIVSRAVNRFRAERVDLVTNVFPRSFPKGQSVEVLSVAALERIVADATAAEREHVTAHIYGNAADFRIGNFSADHPRPGLQLSVDTEEDFRRAEQVVLAAGIAFPTFGLPQILRVIEERHLAGSEP